MLGFEFERSETHLGPLGFGVFAFPFSHFLDRAAKNLLFEFYFSLQAPVFKSEEVSLLHVAY